MLLGLFLVAGLASFASAHKIEVKGGYDLGGKYKIKDAKNNTYIKNIDEDIDAKEMLLKQELNIDTKLLLV